jgi:hypothetical protein
MFKREGALGQATGPPLRHQFLPFLFTCCTCHHFSPQETKKTVWLSESGNHRWVGWTLNLGHQMTPELPGNRPVDLDVMSSALHCSALADYLDICAVLILTSSS